MPESCTLDIARFGRLQPRLSVLFAAGESTGTALIFLTNGAVLPVHHLTATTYTTSSLSILDIHQATSIEEQPDFQLLLD